MRRNERMQFVCDERTFAHNDFAKPQVPDESKGDGKRHHLHQFGDIQRLLMRVDKNANAHQKNPKHPPRKYHRYRVERSFAREAKQSERKGVVEFGEKHTGTVHVILHQRLPRHILWLGDIE